MVLILLLKFFFLEHDFLCFRYISYNDIKIKDDILMHELADSPSVFLA